MATTVEEKLSAEKRLDLVYAILDKKLAQSSWGELANQKCGNPYAKSEHLKVDPLILSIMLPTSRLFNRLALKNKRWTECAVPLISEMKGGLLLSTEGESVLQFFRNGANEQTTTIYYGETSSPFQPNIKFPLSSMSSLMISGRPWHGEVLSKWEREPLLDASCETKPKSDRHRNRM